MMATESIVAPVFFVALVALVAQTFTPEMGNSAAVFITALLSGLAVLYAARTARILAIKEIAKAVAPVEAKIAAIEPVVQRIDTHVNGDKTKALAELAARDLEIKLQQQMITEMQKATALLAQARAATDITAAVAQVTAAVVSSTPAQVAVPGPIVVKAP